MNKKYTVLLITVMLASISLAACDLMRSDSNDTTHLVVRLTDAPRAEMISALVSVDQVEIRSADSVSIVLTDSVQSFDLLSLQNDSSIVLVDRTIPEGLYSQLRLRVGDAAVVEFDDGTSQDFFVPSGHQTGIKILLNDVELNSSEDTLSIMLDFDATESFVWAGQTGSLLFTPVIKLKTADVSGKKLDLE